MIPTGENQSTISLPDHQRPEAGASPVIGLRVRGTDREWPLDPRALGLSVGSAAGCDVQIGDDPYVSALHCMLVRQDGRLVVYDKSKNGTRINGVKCERGYLGDGAHLTVGTTTLIAFSEASRRRLAPLEYLVGPSEAIAQLRQAVVMASATGAHVVVTGEAGAGKRTVAEAIHQESAASAGPFVVLDADVLDAQGIEAALGGGEPQANLIAAAQAGTLLVVAIDRVPARLLALIEQLTARPSGVRLIATVAHAAALGDRRLRWLGDRAQHIAVPPLRERWRDIPALVELFMHELGWPGGPHAISASAMATLCGYPWPGNVRELRHAIRRSMAASTRPELSVELFWPDRTEMAALLRRAIEVALAEQGSFRKAAESLGMAKSTLADLVVRLGIDRGRS